MKRLLLQAARAAACLLPAASIAAAGSPPIANKMPDTSQAVPRAIEATNASLLVVVGAPGAKEYEEVFAKQADVWEQTAGRGGYAVTVIGRDEGATNDLETLNGALSGEPRNGSGRLWIVLIGHGTFDGKEARFNLRGPDLSATQLAAWLKPFVRPIAVVNTSPSSAPFLNALSATNRLIITATRSGHEQYHTRFGEYFAQALTGKSADLDKDEQVSLLEAFLVASRRAGEFYKLNGRIATEHALIDDNGDGLGTPADWFRGVRPTKKPNDKAAIDGVLAQQWHLLPSEADRDLTPEQQVERDQLVQSILQFRERKASMQESEYYGHLEGLLLKLGRLYYPEPSAQKQAEPSPPRFR